MGYIRIEIENFQINDKNKIGSENLIWSWQVLVWAWIFADIAAWWKALLLLSYS